MNYAVIFAGGTGTRMNSQTCPKQFLKLHGKEIIIYTLEHFQNHPDIDGISLVCVDGWIDHLKKIIKKNDITKVRWISPGGRTGQESIYNGLKAMEGEIHEDSLVLIHDGVRPLIDEALISDNIAAAEKFGNAITVVKAYETVVVMGEDGELKENIPRDRCALARAPQTFRYKDILGEHEQCRSKGIDNMIDSATMMGAAGMTLHPVYGKPDNIKITTPMDFSTFKGLIEAKENFQIMGVD